MVHESIYINNHDIPRAEDNHLSKLNRHVVNRDTCNGLCKTSLLLTDEVEQAFHEKASVIVMATILK